MIKITRLVGGQDASIESPKWRYLSNVATMSGLFYTEEL